MADQTTPQSNEAEQSVLGSVLIDPECMTNVSGFLKADDFHDRKNRWIWEVFLNLNEQHTPIDCLTVANTLEQRKQLEEVGGPSYLGKLLEVVPTSINVEAYGRIVLKAATARRTIEAAGKIAKLARDGELDPEEMVGAAQRIAVELGAGLVMARELRSLGKITEEYWDYLKRLSEHPEDFAGVMTRLVDLDVILGGMRAKELLTIAGRPGTGKTALMKTIALNAASKDGKHVALFSLEMADRELIERFLAQAAAMNVGVLHRGALVDSDWPKLLHGAEVLHEQRIFIDDSPAIWPALLRSKLSKHVLTFGSLDLVMVDYMQLMQGDPGHKFNNRVEEVSYISRCLKQIAKEFNVPVLAGAQLSRAVEQRQDKKPILSDLRESGSIEQDSDIVIFIHPDNQSNLAQLIVAKQRQGKTGDIDVYFDKDTTTFQNAARDDTVLPPGM